MSNQVHFNLFAQAVQLPLGCTRDINRGRIFCNPDEISELVFVILFHIAQWLRGKNFDLLPALHPGHQAKNKRNIGTNFSAKALDAPSSLGSIRFNHSSKVENSERHGRWSKDLGELWHTLRCGHVQQPKQFHRELKQQSGLSSTGKADYKQSAKSTVKYLTYFMANLPVLKGDKILRSLLRSACAGSVYTQVNGEPPGEFLVKALLVFRLEVGDEFFLGIGSGSCVRRSLGIAT
ncbi:MAG: hypothetical protein IPH31_04680 [Lewinellaceae bacterium]|nr:hypothetical protein [Lewinellaceae bacterium]